MSAAWLPPQEQTSRWNTAMRSHVGCVRQINEDRALDRPDLSLWAIADGMGGHEAGDRAAQMIVDSLGQADGTRSGWGLLDDIRLRLFEANATLVARNRMSGCTSGATVVVLVARQGRCAWLWAGDSRGYRLRDGVLTRLTRDHSFVQELVDGGVLSPGEARSHPRANVVTRAIGAEQTLEIELRHDTVQPGDLLLLCSDGLTAMLEDSEIARILSSHPINQAADNLIAATLAKGARDNVTVVLAQPR
ncbi:MAG: serine/threonine-protein phosphatase [Pseudolabrys sp.]|nr:serine/threonine-protein phosphatase [Pseudolabrys sp.]